VILRICGVFLASLIAAYACSESRAPSATSSAKPKADHGTIIRVVDGDTIHVSIGGVDKTVRLIGIDTPETHKPGVKVECGGKEATANAQRIATVGAAATLTPDPSQDKVDRYGRLLAYVYVNHRSLQLEQIYAGLAKVYVYNKKPFARVDTYQRAQDIAKRLKRGVWGKCSGDFHSEQPAT
jgi:micrococcal nuclease